MTPPIPGQIYERDGLQRKVLRSDGDDVVSPIIAWREPGDATAYWCDRKHWNGWASKATLVEAFTPAEVADVRRLEQEAAATVGPRVPFKKVPERKGKA